MDLWGLEGNLGGFLMEAHPRRSDDGAQRKVKEAESMPEER